MGWQRVGNGEQFPNIPGLDSDKRRLGLEKMLDAQHCDCIKPRTIAQSIMLTFTF